MISVKQIKIIVGPIVLAAVIYFGFDLMPGNPIGGIPVSTTHTITGAIVGVGATRRLSAVRWGVARTVVWAWVLTIPLSAGIASLVLLVVQLAYKL